MNRWLAVFVLGTSFSVAGCCGGKKNDSSQSQSLAVDWKGDAKTCAAIKACCGAPEMSLFCSLTQSANQGDCGKSVATIRNYAKESKAKVAASCF